MASKAFAFCVLVLFLLSQDIVLQTEGRMCESSSHGFKGTCVRDHNCALVCRTEHFSGGECMGIRRRCMCTKPC